MNRRKRIANDVSFCKDFNVTNNNNKYCYVEGKRNALNVDAKD